MTNCYSILGVRSSASAAEIRAAYLAKMKALHPDTIPDVRAGQVDARDVTFAYWQLRDTHRRAQHDAALHRPAPAPALQPRRPATSRRTIAAKRGSLSLRARARRSARLQPVRTAAGALAFSVAALGFVLAFTYLQPDGAGPARAASLVMTGQSMAPLKEPMRRPLDPVLVRSAAAEFRLILRTSGLKGAHVYGRQCLAQLAARPSLSILDYCLAFDDAAADWESRIARRGAEHRYFDEEQRFARYDSVSKSMREASVLEALRNEVTYFASLQAHPPSAAMAGVATAR